VSRRPGVSRRPELTRQHGRGRRGHPRPRRPSAAAAKLPPSTCSPGRAHEQRAWAGLARVDRRLQRPVATRAQSQRSNLCAGRTRRPAEHPALIRSPDGTCVAGHRPLVARRNSGIGHARSAVARDGDIVEGDLPSVCKLLAPLVSLAGDHDDVAVPGPPIAGPIGSAAVGVRARPVRAIPSQDLGNDRFGVLGPGVVARSRSRGSARRRAISPHHGRLRGPVPPAPKHHCRRSPVSSPEAGRCEYVLFNDPG